MPNQELLKTEMPKVLPVSMVINEGKDQKTVFVPYKGNISPGQFFMVWIPGIDAKPYAVSYYNKNEIGFTSAAIGKFSYAFNNLKTGDKIGLLGPYGNSFSVKNNACVVAGGIGISSVSTLIDKLKNPAIIYGARKKDYLIYLKRYKNKKMVIMTDDGSYGKKGFTTDALNDLLKADKDARKSKIFGTNSVGIKIVYTCGPEVMMKRALEICNKYKVECEASLERYMSCGFGICGKCAVNDKIICIDGPIFSSKDLNKMSEFGKFARLKSCNKVAIEEYHKWRSA